MIRLYPEQLGAQLRETLRACFFLFGNDPLLLQESQDAIRRQAEAAGFAEHLSVILDPSTDWNAIFGHCQAMSLFASRRTLTLLLPENGVNAALGEKLTQLAALLHPDLLLILRGNRPSRAQENSAWYKTLGQDAVQVSCMTPERAQLPRWVATRAAAMHLVLDDAANQLLCYCYEGNLLALSQSLERLSLTFPDGKLTLPRVESAVNDAAHFTPFHWVDAVLAAKCKRAGHILRQLRREGEEPVILLRSLQRELMLLLMLQRQSAGTSLRALMDQHKVWQSRRPLLTQALQRLSPRQLHGAVALMARTEVALKQDYGAPVWPDLEALTLMLCGKLTPGISIHV
ncbi:DNA polymerase III subunit delta [Martelella alba]|uniref:DNA polymerase III subunit delta n=1 Tax=Martelella alba TaxID=2590451 RepID=A0ABY2SM85_9HYPH|nr:DNA polymerase III subunit delta [Martelella alba]TKI05478.1 DNA polymerase III subunit delta [Martelella alba]